MVPFEPSQLHARKKGARETHKRETIASSKRSKQRKKTQQANAAVKTRKWEEISEVNEERRQKQATEVN